MTVRTGIIALAFALCTGNLHAEAEGEYLVRTAGCIHCHTDTENGGKTLAGGRRLQTPFGIFYSTNITPDPETGIGGWSREDFLLAVRRGLAPDGSHYFPAFPYTSYTKMTDEDIEKIRDYLAGQTPVKMKNKEHEIPLLFSFRPLLGIWKFLFFDEGPAPPSAEKNAAWNRGNYLVNAVLHCGECHTPRNILGAVIGSEFLSGNSEGAEIDSSSPNITPHENGIGLWTASDIKTYLKSGMEPDGDFAGDQMGEIIDRSLKYLTAEDLDAAAAYLKSIPPIEGEKKKESTKNKSGEAWE